MPKGIQIPLVDPLNPAELNVQAEPGTKILYFDVNDGLLKARNDGGGDELVGGEVTFVHNAVVTAAASPYAASIQETVKANPAAGPIDIDLPTAIGNTGKKVQVTVVSAHAVPAPNPVNVNGTLAQTINGQASIPLTIGGQSLVVESDGANWVPIA